MTAKQQLMIDFARCRRLATEAAAAAAAAAPPARPTSIRPARPPLAYRPDLSGVPPLIMAGLLKAIAAIERHDATLPGDTYR